MVVVRINEAMQRLEKYLYMCQKGLEGYKIHNRLLTAGSFWRED